VERSILGTNAPLYQTTSMVPSLALAVLGSTCASAEKTSELGRAAARRCPCASIRFEKRHRASYSFIVFSFPLALHRVDGDVVVLAQLLQLVELLLKPGDMAFELVVALAVPLHQVLVEVEVRHVAGLVALLAEIGEAGNGSLLGGARIVQNVVTLCASRRASARIAARLRGTAAGW
jgi:hypothetical protein